MDKEFDHILFIWNKENMKHTSDVGSWVEVVVQIDKLTSDFDFDLEPDDSTVATASSTSSSERGLGDAFRLDLLNPDMLSDSWEFCSYLEATGSGRASPGCSPGPSAPPELGHGTVPAQTRIPTTPPPSATTASAYSQMNGGLPIPNGPRIVTPDSSSEEACSSTHSHKASRTAGTRERVRFSDKILYHALCCDDDEDEAAPAGAQGEKCGRAMPESRAETGPLASSVAPKRSYSEHSLHYANFLDPSYVPSPVKGTTGAHTLPRKGLLNPGCRKKLLRNSSTQTVSDKSTQTVLPYIPTKQKTKDH
ncbi:hypothetical protein NHX12_005423 [Muraenolepis orangiensis]|uniref:Inhibitory synaptic factor 1 n=1 Tax=Muraenolepis orangiensis TaxID=630683 RepID=A0A9Q0DSW7_9TELE|nr:hypothetical protein NHX12_005423 [Muraenolepis orangiensis]